MHEWKMRPFALTFVIGLVGIVSGWAVGFLISPASEAEKSDFNKYIGTISAFISGYFISKVGPIIDKLLTAELVFYNHVNSLRLLTFCFCFISAVLIMYMIRVYFKVVDEQSKEQKKAEAKNKGAVEVTDKDETSANEQNLTVDEEQTDGA